MRTEAIEEIQKTFNIERANIKQDYKRKHKDAVRRVKKIGIRQKV